MTRRQWADLRDKHLKTPEQQALYAAAGAALTADLAEYQVLLKPPPNIALAEVQKRREALENKHPEWFEDR